MGKGASPFCDYCGQPASFSPTSAHLYRGTDYGPVWECLGCEAWVGCHPDDRPLGRLANAELRRAKIDAHAAFDPFVARKMERDGITKKFAQRAGYTWLAEELGIEPKDCHIAMMDLEMCQRVVEVCNAFRASQVRWKSGRGS